MKNCVPQNQWRNNRGSEEDILPASQILPILGGTPAPQREPFCGYSCKSQDWALTSAVGKGEALKGKAMFYTRWKNCRRKWKFWMSINGFPTSSVKISWSRFWNSDLNFHLWKEYVVQSGVTQPAQRETVSNFSSFSSMLPFGFLVAPGSRQPGLLFPEAGWSSSNSTTAQRPGQ